MVIGALSSSAQRTTVYRYEDKDYVHAMDLFDKAKYVAAQKEFEGVITRYDNQWKEEIYANARYYYALCALNLYQDDAERLLQQFIQDLPENPKVKMAYFQLGVFKFRKHKYDDAIVWFEKIDIYDLSNEELAEYYFKLGYSYFREGNLDKASTLLHEIKDTDTKYTTVARYYYAHIAYEQGKYETAYIDFRKIEDDEKFGPLAPYYITQILYFQEKYDQLIRYAPTVLDSANPKREKEIARLLGQAYYKTEDFQKAVEYLEYSHRGSRYVTPTDAYQLARSYAMIKDYSNAIIWYQQAIQNKDSLAQLAYFQLGKAYLASGAKKDARDALREASNYAFYPDIKKQALFNYAKLSYELSYHPFDDAIIAFEEFINTYPNAPELNDAYEYLVGVYFSTKNYKGALASLERIKKKGPKLEEAYQKVAYYRGLELYRAGRFKEAISLFGKSAMYDHLKDISALNMYWTGQAYYHTDKYKESIDLLEKFMITPGAIAEEEFHYASYNIGYAYYKMGELDKAILWFRRFAEEKDVEPRMVNDALLRTADAYYLKREYLTAVEYYDKSALMGVFDVDYAYYQSAMANGQANKPEDKANLLYTLIKDYENGKYPRKSYLDDAMYNLGKTYFNQNKTEDALVYYKKLVSDYKESSYRYKALLDIGLIHYNKKEDDLALAAYKEVYTNSPVAADKEAALAQIETILKEAGRIDELEEFKKSAGIKYDDKQLEKDLFEIAQNKYLEGDWNAASSAYEKYLKRFPHGLHALESHYYNAESLFRLKRNEEALKHYAEVANASSNEYTERAYLQCGMLAKELSKLDQARNYYSKIISMNISQESVQRAQLEMFDIVNELNDTTAIIHYSYVILMRKELDRDLSYKVKLSLGRAYYQLNNDSAEAVLKTLKWVKNEIGAEASYYLARMEFKGGELKKTEDDCFRILDVFAGYNDWVARSFILLADVYMVKEDFYQAKVALNNVLDNYEGDPEILAEAEDKLEMIEQLEQAKKKGINKTAPEIDLGGDGSDKGKKDKGTEKEE